MIGFHGTSATIASQLQNGAVDVTTGGGELGRGFYTGQYLWAAKSWAFGRYAERQKNVVEFDIPDPEINRLHVEIRDGASATLIRSNLRRSRTTRTHLFGCDMMWTPIVGKETITCDQHKWESDISQALLNGPKVVRKII
ncbi:hypothetical protein [Sphingobium yanoikuyae]|uniref:DUF3990 domain-containing protein n=1 Tax=Sphingobium yanoikuyae TaxID=13690 RepID=A0A291MUN0_SPHYA|nr:hypothetical protein [Sphingobium yanoikuyae]ATI78824.1 hypothetical protein A6768_01650 [Sphingobium yanoikuyae]WBQ16961.1 hypothetical protein PAE53_01795 [Sphingobium yanoikuyae]